MSDTPRVDAAEIRHGKAGYSYLTVNVEFARQLERELRRQHAEIERLSATVKAREDEILTHSEAFYEVTRLLSEEREKNERLREEVRNWWKSFAGHVYVKTEDYAELVGSRDALKAENERLRGALELALNCHGKLLMSDPPQDAWKFHRVDEVIRAALRR